MPRAPPAGGRTLLLQLGDDRVGELRRAHGGGIVGLGLEVVGDVLALGDHLGEPDAAERLEQAVADVIREGKRVTYDMKPSRDDPTAVGTSEYADAIIEKLGA